VSSYYLDSNSKSPLSDSVKRFLLKGDFDFSNPGSIHKSGRKAREQVDLVTDYLYKLFNLKRSSYHLFFHSGATEGVNTFMRGVAAKAANQGDQIAYFYSSVDHPVSFAIARLLKEQGHITCQFPVDRNGAFDLDQLVGNITSTRRKVSEVFLNYQAVNGVTGVVWPLSWANRVKKESGCYINVDYTQAPGRVDQWEQLDDSLDAYHFSGHKFGALPGVGFSFINSLITIPALVVGGGQQQGIRSGTENVLGIYTLQLALEDLVTGATTDQILLYRSELEQLLQKTLDNRGEVIANRACYRAANTTYFVVKGVKAQELVVALDIAGLEVSAGTACSSGVVIDYYILEAMGYSSADYPGGVRVSLPPTITYDQLHAAKTVLSGVLERYLV
jgi:cysteine desulfurase